MYKNTEKGMLQKMYRDWVYAQYLAKKYSFVRQTLPRYSPPMIYNMSSESLVLEWKTKSTRKQQYVLAQKVEVVSPESSIIVGCSHNKRKEFLFRKGISKFYGRIFWGTNRSTVESASKLFKTNLYQSLQGAIMMINGEIINKIK